MAGDIKGITVEIGGDVNPLSKALKAVNSEARGLQKELNGVESLLKLDPSNVDLLRQKEELLNQSIRDTNTKLEALKAAKAQADRDMANGTQVNQKEYRNLVREIASTENKLDDLTQSMKKFGSVTAQQIAAAGGKMQEFGDKLGNIGGSLSTKVTAPLTAGLALATEGTREFRSDLARLETNAEQAGKSMDKMNDYMKQIVGVTDEVDSSVEGLSNLLAAGISDEGFQEMMDALSGAAIKFSDTLRFEGISDGLQETLATGSAVGPFAELLERSGMVLDDFNAGLQDAITNGEQENFILDTLSKTGLANFYQQFREGNPDLIDAAEAQYELQSELAKLGKLLDPIAAQFVSFAAMLLEKFNDISPEMQKVILVIAGIAAAIGPVILIVGNLITSFGAIVALAPKLVTGFQLVKTALAAIGGPITIVMALIGVLIAKFVHTYQTSEEFRNKVNAAFDAVKNTVTSVITAIKNKVTQFIAIGRNMAEGLWQGISNAKTWLLNKVKEWCGSVLNGIKAFFGIHSPSTVFRDEVGKNMALGMAEGIKDGTTEVLHAVDDMGTAVLSETNDVLDSFQQNVESRADAISSFAGLFDAVTQNTDVSAQSLIDNLSGQVELLSQWQNDLQDLMSKGISDAMLDELREQGPKAAAEIHALTQMSDDELGAFGELYAQKIKLSTESAIAELGGLQLAVKPVVSEMAENAAYAVNSNSGSSKQVTDNEKMYNLIAETFATALLEGLNYVGNSIFDAIPKILDFYIDSVKMAKTTWDAFDGEGDRRNRMFAPTYGEIYSIALRAAKSVSNTN